MEVRKNDTARRMGMSTDLIRDRGRGPEIVGTRITVFNLLPDFLEPARTEADMCRIYELAPEQVAAARAYVLNNAETVLAKHLEIEARIAIGNPPHLIEKMRETHATLLRFKDWLAKREKDNAQGPSVAAAPESGRNGSGPFPAFKEWLAEQESRPREGS
jgi:uncharacterized protein (DUF433 family)